MAKISTPNLCYYTSDESGEPQKFADMEEATAFASRAALRTTKHTSVLVYNKEDRFNVDDPVAVINVKVTYSPWK